MKRFYLMAGLAAATAWAGNACADEHDALLQQAAELEWRCASAVAFDGVEDGEANTVVDFRFVLASDNSFTGTGWERINIDGVDYTANFTSDGYLFDGESGFGFFIRSTRTTYVDPPLPDTMQWNDGRDIRLTLVMRNDGWGMEGYSNLADGRTVTFSDCGKPQDG